MRKKIGKTISKIVKSKFVRDTKLLIVIPVVFLVYLLFLMYTSFNIISIIDSNGYALVGNEMFRRLKSDNVKNSAISMHEIKQFEVIYGRGNSFYVGDKNKIRINEVLPVYTNNNTILMSLSDKTKFIDEDFRVEDGYANFLLADGVLFNSTDKERANAKDYYFLALDNELFINSKSINIKTANRTVTMPANSIINFSQDFMKYYSPDGKKFLFEALSDVDFSTLVTIGESTLTYNELLIKLGIIGDLSNDDLLDKFPELNEKEKAKPKTPTIVLPPEGPKYQRPTVSCGSFKSWIYSMNGNISIYDPSEVMTSGVKFEFMTDGKIFLRKEFSSSGKINIVGLKPETEYEIIGRFTYMAEDGETEREANCLTEIKTTGAISSLEPIRVSFSNGGIYYNSIEAKHLKILNIDNYESLNAAKRGGILIGNDLHAFSMNQLTDLKDGKEIVFKTNGKVPSNSIIDYSIVFYDSFGVQLPIINNVGQTNTSKAIPSVTLIEDTTKREVDQAVITSKLNNKDEVIISNYRCVIFDDANAIVVFPEGEEPNCEIDEATTIGNLLESKKYTMNVYADFDLEDGYGVLKDQLIGKTIFWTAPITKLGTFFVNVTVDDKKLKSDRANIVIAHNMSLTDANVAKFLSKVRVSITKRVGEQDVEIDGGAATLTGTPLREFLEGNTRVLDLTGLDSFTKYAISITAELTQGGVIYSYPVNFYVNEGKDPFFNTPKRDAEVFKTNVFIAEDIIDFDVRIDDWDDAILPDVTGSREVTLVVTDIYDNVLDSVKIAPNAGLQHIAFEGLQVDSPYKFVYTAPKYNVWGTSTSTKVGHPIKEEIIWTKESITGTIGLEELTRKGSTDTADAKLIVSFENKYANITDGDDDDNSSYAHLFYYVRYFKNNVEVDMISNPLPPETDYVVTDAKSTYEVDFGPNITYRFELLAYVNGKFYVIDSIEFTTEKNISSISNTTELQAALSSTAANKYVVLQPLDVTGIAKVYTNAFNGEIDFQGKELKISSTTLSANNTTTAQHYIASLGTTAVIKNLNLSIYMNNSTWVQAVTYFVGTNNGKITNAKITLKQSVLEEWGNVNIALLTATNDNSGIIENFAVELEATPYMRYGFSTITTTNNGIVRNGYVYGKNINMDFDPYDLSDSSKPNRNAAGIVRNNAKLASMIENVYSLVNIDIPQGSASSINTANVLGLSTSGTLRNAYSVGIGHRNNTAIGPTVGTVTSMHQYRNIYYLADEIRNNAHNIKVSKLSMREESFQDRTLNANGHRMFETNAMCYPRLKWGKGMPTQTCNLLPDVKGTDIVDIIDTQIISEDYDNDVVEVEFIINNPAGEIIEAVNFNTDVNNVPSLTAELCTTERYNAGLCSKGPIFDKGKTTIRAKLSNPQTFISKYYVRSVPSRAAYDITYANCTAAGSAYITKPSECPNTTEKIIEVDFYKKIRTEADWKAVNTTTNLTYNYQLLNELNFDTKAASEFIWGTFSGKLEGRGNTIRNMHITTTAPGVINTLTGTVSNLNVEKLSFNNTANSTATVGFIGTSSNPATINNVHINDVSVINTVASSGKVGGLIGTAANSTIMNSSVTKFEVSKNTAKGKCSLSVGGFIGTAVGNQMNNNYVQGVDIDLTGGLCTSTAAGTGGFIGYTSGLNMISDAYAAGKIYNELYYTGGFIGVSNSDVVDRVYSRVDIVSERTNLGGFSGNGISATIRNIVVFGDIESKNETTSINRITGNGSTTSANQGDKFAYTMMKINNVIPTGTANSNGETLLSFTKLKRLDTYTDDIKLGDQFQYTDAIMNGVLPKLYYSGTTNLLNEQNQKDIKIIEKETLDIISARIEANDTLTVEINNPEKLTVNSVTIHGMTLAGITVGVDGIDPSKTILKAVATPTRYFDSYKLTSITHSGNKEIEKDFRISLATGKEYWRTICNITDWNAYMSDTDAQNYILSDSEQCSLDFSSTSVILNNVRINRLKTANNTQITISNVDSSKFKSANESFIAHIEKQFSRVNFENIEVVSTKASSVLNRGFGVIARNNGSITNVNFENVTVSAVNTDMVGMIGVHYGTTIDTINMKRITVSANSYVGGLVGHIYTTLGTHSIKNVFINDTGLTTDTISVTPKGSYAGGIIGFLENGNADNYTNFTVKNLTINPATATSYMGAVAGRVVNSGAMTNITVDNISLKGATYVGGVVGDGNVGTSGTTASNGATVTNLRINAGTDRVGGVIGTGNVNNSTVRDSYIKSTGSYSGGIAGIRRNDSKTFANNIVERVVVDGATQAGGLVGNIQYQTATNNKIKKSSVTGTNYVGGVIGYQKGGNVTATSVIDVNIEGTGSYVGGISGQVAGTTTILGVNIYSSDNNSTLICNKSTVLGDLNANCNKTQVKGVNYVGGIAGYYLWGNQTSNYNTNIQGSTNNATIIATGSGAGGVMGYFHDKDCTTGPTRYRNILYINNNIVTGGSVTGNTNVGGLVGLVAMATTSQHSSCVTTNPHTSTIQLNNNIVESDLILKTDATSIRPIVGSSTAIDHKVSNYKIYSGTTLSIYNGTTLVSTKSGLNLVAADLASGDGTTRGTVVTTSELTQNSTYTAFSTTYVDSGTARTDNLSAGKYPYTRLSSTAYPPEYTTNTFSLPPRLRTDEVTGVQGLRSMSFGMIEKELPKANVYAVDSDKINIEFNKVDYGSDFIIRQNGKDLVTQMIDDRIFTISYNFKDSFELEIRDGTSSIAKTIKAKDLVRKATLYNGNYYYIKDNNIVSNKKNKSGNFINIYGSTALDKSGYVYELETSKKLEKVNNFVLAEEKQPLYNFEYSDVTVSTYGTYSVVSEEDQVSEKDMQIFVRNGQIEAIKADLENVKDSIIISKSGSTDFLTVLGNDGKLYDLKGTIKLPGKFRNRNIEYMTSDVYGDSNIAMVYYKNGAVYVFDYVTGKMIFQENIKEHISLSEYMKEAFQKKEYVVPQGINKSYLESVAFQNKLETNPLNKVLNEILRTGENLAVNQNAKYIPVYNPITKKYDVYSEGELFNTEVSKTLSENTKTKRSIGLSSFYEANSRTNILDTIGGLWIFICILILILISMAYLYFKNNKMLKKA